MQQHCERFEKMDSVKHLEKNIFVARSELNNLRKKIEILKKNHVKDTNHVKSLLDFLSKNNPGLEKHSKTPELPSDVFSMKPIGYLQSSFTFKNGTPRQSSICPTIHVSLTIEKSIFNNPEHSLEGLQDYSHVWLIFVFHKNDKPYFKAKVKPPRLNGAKIGLFATRSPHRPNPLGLTMAKLEYIHGATLFLSGVDILNGTPVLDIKPFIPSYDSPVITSQKLTDTLSEEKLCPANEPMSNVDNFQGSTFNNDSTCTSYHKWDQKVIEENNCPDDVKIPSWITKPLVNTLKVIFTKRAETQLNTLWSNNSDKTTFFHNESELKAAILHILGSDPRSVYRRKHCQDRLYFVSIDCFHFTCWFDDDDSIVEVVRVKCIL